MPPSGHYWCYYTGTLSYIHFIATQLKIGVTRVSQYVVKIRRSFLLLLGLSGRRGIVVACVCPSVRPFVRPSVRKLYLVRAITRHRFELESPNLHQTCIMGYSRWVLTIEVIDLDLQGHFRHLTQNSRSFGLSAR